MEKLHEEMREEVASAVASGFGSQPETIQRIVEYFEDEYQGDDLHHIAEKMVKLEWNRHLAVQATWPEVTDCDRLTLAFEELNKNGIVARENFTCCGNCGCSEIGLEEGAETAEGYVFYHWQDTDSAVDGYGLCFNYGSFSEDNEKHEQLSIEIGHRVVAALKAVGLTPEWDGDLRKRIYLPLDWKKRRV